MPNVKRSPGKTPSTCPGLENTTKVGKILSSFF